MDSTVHIHNGEVPKLPNSIRFVCASDTHSRPFSLPAGDILIHAGDFTKKGTAPEVHEFVNYLHRSPFKHKVIVAGNHDSPFDVENYADILSKRRNPIPCDPIPIKLLLRPFVYLEDSFAVVEGYKIWGSPWTKQHYKGAFTLKDKEKLRKKREIIPENIDILVTHSPPYCILDTSKDNRSVGCEFLLDRVQQIRPKLHIFGHIHESSGFVHLNGTTFINASICNSRYLPINPPRVFDLPLLC
jgi:predicted phosphohydrolase